MAYQWRNNPACVATYSIMEGEKFLDLFEDKDIPFDDAGIVTMADLQLFPGNDSYNDLIAEQFALKFEHFARKSFAAGRENLTEKLSVIVADLAAVFLNSEATMADLAERADAHFRFPNEV